MVEVGVKYKIETRVDEAITARSIGSGLLEVLSTPSMIALMERSAHLSVLPYMENGFDTVGTEVSIRHLRATPMGSKVYAECELIEVNGRELIFKVAAYDEKGAIGEGIHKRFIIDVQKFSDKLK